MRLFLCGGGSGNQITDAMKVFGKIIDKSKPLLYVPLAMDKEKYPSCLEWITNEMRPIGINNICMVKSKEELAAKEYNNYCAIFIGGGNTYKLLNDLKESNSFTKIKTFIENNGIVFGGSAGAIIFGEDIDTCKFSDSNEIIKIKDTKGFNVLNDTSLLCHYKHNEDKTKKNINYLKEFCKNKKAIYLPEEDTIFIDNDKISIIGNKNCCVIENGNVRVINPSETSFKFL